MNQRPRMEEYLNRLQGAVDQNPLLIAIRDESRMLTFAALADEVSVRTKKLIQAGLEPSDRVAIVAENSADFAITVLALWKADAVPMTIYPSTTEADLAATLDDADPVLVIHDSTSEALVRVASGNRPVAGMAADGTVPTITRSMARTPEELIDRLALVCYSSGTEARPKAIMLSAEAISNGTLTFAEMWHLGPEDVTLVCLPMAWLFGLTTTTLTALAAGGAVVILRRARPEAITAAVERYGITFLPTVTTVLTKLAHHLRHQGHTDLRSSPLRLIVSGGEPRNEASFAVLREVTGLPVHDNYCASEMQPLVTYDPIRDPLPVPGAAGQLVPRSELKILDDQGRAVAIGEVGEGFSRGPGIMLGYWNDPEGTKAALTTDGWYRTKDLLRQDEDGYIHVIGRVSDMIIRGGSNVSPGEVEACLVLHPDVAAAAVVGLPDPLYGEEVVAVVQPTVGEDPQAESLMTHCLANLARYKAPTRIEFVDALPLNGTSGKVDRKAVRRSLEISANGDPR